MDKEDLRLITSRETPQENKTLLVIKMHSAKKCLELLAEISELNDTAVVSTSLVHGPHKKCHQVFYLVYPVDAAATSPLCSTERSRNPQRGRDWNFGDEAP